MAVFANDGYMRGSWNGGEVSERASRVIASLRAELSRLGLRVLGFGTSEDNYSWAMLVQNENAENLHRLVWQLDEGGFPKPLAYHDAQSRQAIASLSERWDVPIVRPDGSAVRQSR